mmetsp:Transcript_47369/g.109634  ORF Transcript_47369/g.109634 Transcript_47369/m.109634 type:complete len:213 (-) Transcript_47369:1782-2420(-)
MNHELCPVQHLHVRVRRIRKLQALVLQIRVVTDVLDEATRHVLPDTGHIRPLLLTGAEGDQRAPAARLANCIQALAVAGAPEESSSRERPGKCQARRQCVARAQDHGRAILPALLPLHIRAEAAELVSQSTLRRELPKLVGAIVVLTIPNVKLVPHALRSFSNDIQAKASQVVQDMAVGLHHPLLVCEGAHDRLQVDTETHPSTLILKKPFW